MLGDLDVAGAPQLAESNQCHLVIGPGAWSLLANAASCPLSDPASHQVPSFLPPRALTLSTEKPRILLLSQLARVPEAPDASGICSHFHHASQQAGHWLHLGLQASSTGYGSGVTWPPMSSRGTSGVRAVPSPRTGMTLEQAPWTPAVVGPLLWTSCPIPPPAPLDLREALTSVQKQSPAASATSAVECPCWLWSLWVTLT